MGSLHILWSFKLPLQIVGGFFCKQKKTANLPGWFFLKKVLDFYEVWDLLSKLNKEHKHVILTRLST